MTVGDLLQKRILLTSRIAARLLLIAATPLIFLVAADGPALAQTEGQQSVASVADSSSANDLASTGTNAVIGGAGVSPAQTGDEPTEVEKSLFSSLFMSGKTQDQFKPLTARERLTIYAKDLISPFHFILAGASAGIAQLQDAPKAWGLGAQGYGLRFANYYGNATIASVLQTTGEDILHEDNLYYGSGEHGVWKRLKYALKSSVLARGNDGTQHFSVSQVGSTAGASFISRIWQPRSSSSAGDGAVNFGINMASNAGVNVVREFLPGAIHHAFHHEK